VSISNRPSRTSRPAKFFIPGPRSRKLAQRLRRVESRNVTFVSEKFPVFWESAKGAWVRDVDGHHYLDLTSSFAVASLGHQSPAIAKAAHRQMDRLWHGMGDVHPTVVKVELLEALAKLAPGDLSVSILSSSGAEAVESALKTARLLTGKPKVLCFRGGYHGLSYGTLAVCDRTEFRGPFEDQLASIGAAVPYPDTLHGPSEEDVLDQIDRWMAKGKALAEDIGAILVEPMQGRGGIRVPRPIFMKGLREIATRHNLLLVADEIYTGFGRTGKRFGVDHAGVVPDLLCVGKALSNGFPISACIGSPKVMSAWPASDGEAIHTSTFLGNPLVCAMALASLKELEMRKLAARSAALGKWWKDELAYALGADPRVAEIRGLGLMIGVEIVTDINSLAPHSALAGLVVTEALRRGLIVLAGGVHRNVITLTPPLTITKQELAIATAILKDIFNASHPSKN
jgi:4-aminobutyrate aminotransferase-like enzyme